MRIQNYQEWDEKRKKWRLINHLGYTMGFKDTPYRDVEQRGLRLVSDNKDK